MEEGKLEKERAIWLEMRNNSKEEADEFYWTELFPLIRNSFQERCKEFRCKYDALIMTVGTTPQPLILTLDAVKPQRVIFIYSKSTEKHLMTVIKEVGFLADHSVIHDRARIDSDDPTEIYSVISKRFRELCDEGLTRCAIDNTGGKKSTVGAAGLAAYFLGIDLLYVDFLEYSEEFRMPVPGTEFLARLQNPLVQLGDLKIDECKKLFNACIFEAAENRLDEVVEELEGEAALPIKTKVDILQKVVRGYSLWDKFQFSKAYSELIEAYELGFKYEVPLNYEGMKENLEALEVLKHDTPNKGEEQFIQNREHPEIGLHLAADLICNSGRRERAGCPDDAIVRVYRCIELISQIRLAQAPAKIGRGFDNNNMDWANIPDNVMARYNMLVKKVFRYEPKTSSKLGLMHSHILLAAFMDPIWNADEVAGLKKLKNAVDIRNELLLLHGKRRAKQKDLEGLLNFAERMLVALSEIMGEDYDNLLTIHTFISL